MVFNFFLSSTIFPHTFPHVSCLFTEILRSVIFVSLLKNWTSKNAFLYHKTNGVLAQKWQTCPYCSSKNAVKQQKITQISEVPIHWPLIRKKPFRKHLNYNHAYCFSWTSKEGFHSISKKKHTQKTWDLTKNNGVCVCVFFRLVGNPALTNPSAFHPLGTEDLLQLGDHHPIARTHQGARPGVIERRLSSGWMDGGEWMERFIPTW